MSFGQIVRQRREELKLTLDDVSNKIGFSKPYLSTIETGKLRNPPSDKLIKKLERVLKFERGLLLKISHLENLPSDIRQEYESAEAENEKLRQLLKNLISKKTSKTKANRFLKNKNTSPIKSDGTFAAGRLIPVINKVAAGYPTDFDDLDYPVGIADDYVRCPDLHDPNAFAVRVVGNSMEPKFKEDDIVVFSPAAEVKNGDDCFIRFTMPHETTFKRVFFEKNKTIRLQPRNDKHSPIIVENNRINGIYRAVLKYERL